MVAILPSAFLLTLAVVSAGANCWKSVTEMWDAEMLFSQKVELSLPLTCPLRLAETFFVANVGLASAWSDKNRANAETKIFLISL